MTRLGDRFESRRDHRRYTVVGRSRDEEGEFWDVLPDDADYTWGCVDELLARDFVAIEQTEEERARLLESEPVCLAQLDIAREFWANWNGQSE